MAFPSRRQLIRDVPFRNLNLCTIQSIAILLDFEIVSRQVLGELGFTENEVNSWCDRFKRPVFEALRAHRNRNKTIYDLYRVLDSTNQTQALQKLYSSLCEDLNHMNVHLPEAATSENWTNLLNSTQQKSNISQPELFMRRYIYPTFNRVLGFVFMVFLCSYAYGSDMYRNISKIINTFNIIFSLMTLIQNAITIYQEGRFDNLVHIIISISFWMKLSLINRHLNELKELLSLGYDEEELQRANVLYKEIRIALRCVFFFKLALAMLCCPLFYAIPELLNKNLQSQMTQVGFFFSCLSWFIMHSI